MLPQRTLLCLALAALSSAGWNRLSVAFESVSEPPRKIFSFVDKRIDESSGLAASRRYPGFLWTHNDSLNSASLFLVNGQGSTAAIVNLPDAENFDWEDLAIAGTGNNAWLYIGDTGDNFHIRSALTVYRLREPQIDPEKTGQAVEARGVEKMTLRFPDGEHDAETLLATSDGRLLVLTKEAPGRLYITSAPFRDQMQQVLRFVGALPLAGEGNARLASGGDLSPSGRKLAVVSLKRLYEWQLAVPYDFSSLSTLSASVRDLPKLPQCEAVCYSSDGSKIFVSSEKSAQPVYEFTSLFTSHNTP